MTDEPKIYGWLVGADDVAAVTTERSAHLVEYKTELEAWEAVRRKHDRVVLQVREAELNAQYLRDRAAIALERAEADFDNAADAAKAEATKSTRIRENIDRLIAEQELPS